MTLILDKSQSISYHPLDANILMFLTLVTFCKDFTTVNLERNVHVAYSCSICHWLCTVVTAHKCQFEWSCSALC